MISLRSSKFIEFIDDNGTRKSKELLELEVDTVAELPDGEIDGIVIAHGSIAHIVTTGDLYSVAGNGNWYNQDGSDAPEPETEQTAQVSPQLSPSISPTVLNRTQLADIEPVAEPDEEVTADDESVRGAESE
jgi:hypothetical protein